MDGCSGEALVNGTDLQFLVADAIADGVGVIGPDGVVAWVNQGLVDLVGGSRESLLGSNGLDLVHPEDVARAVDGIAYAQQFPGRTAVAPFRVRRADGTYLDAEVKTGILHRDAGDFICVVMRDGTTRRAMNRALESVATGQPLDRTLELIGDVITSRWPNTGLAISLPSPDGANRVYTVGLGSELVDHAASRLAGLGGRPPWELVAGPDPIAVMDRTEMPPSLQQAAVRAGFEGFGVALVTGPVDRAGCIVVWFDHTVIARLEFPHAAPELVELLCLGLEREHHLHELWVAARHDPLTGLLNRTGFSELFDREVEASRGDADEVTGALYIDLDGLKGVNDRFGHAAGDRVLTDVAKLLTKAVGPETLVARLGGDEFAVAVRLPVADAEDLVADYAGMVVEALTLSVSGRRSSREAAGTGGDSVQVAASVGLAIDDGTSPPGALLERADAAMYRAKAAGKSRWSR